MPPKDLPPPSRFQYLKQHFIRTDVLTKELAALRTTLKQWCGYGEELVTILDSDSLVPRIVAGDTSGFAAWCGRSSVEERLRALVEQNRRRCGLQLEQASEIRQQKAKLEQLANSLACANTTIASQNRELERLHARSESDDRMGHAQQDVINKQSAEIDRQGGWISKLTERLAVVESANAALAIYKESVQQAHKLLNELTGSAEGADVSSRIKRLCKDRDALLGQFTRELDSLRDFQKRVGAALDAASPGWLLPVGFVTFAQAAAGAIGVLKKSALPPNAVVLTQVEHVRLLGQQQRWLTVFKAFAQAGLNDSYNPAPVQDRVAEFILSPAKVRSADDREALLKKVNSLQLDLDQNRALVGRMLSSVREAMEHLPNVAERIHQLEDDLKHSIPCRLFRE